MSHEFIKRRINQDKLIELFKLISFKGKLQSRDVFMILILSDFIIGIFFSHSRVLMLSFFIQQLGKIIIILVFTKSNVYVEYSLR